MKNGYIGGTGQSHPSAYFTLTLLHATCHQPHSEFTEAEPLRESHKDPFDLLSRPWRSLSQSPHIKQHGPNPHLLVFLHSTYCQMLKHDLCISHCPHTGTSAPGGQGLSYSHMSQLWNRTWYIPCLLNEWVMDLTMGGKYWIYYPSEPWPNLVQRVRKGQLEEVTFAG